jgi:hypothetical protein
LLIALLLLATVVGNADAQYKRLSWDGCDPQVPDKTYNPVLSPQNYVLVVSAIGLTQPMIGHDSQIFIGPAVQDAWRFDEAGCQTGSQLTISDNGMPKAGCPALKGGTPLPITDYSYDPVAMNCQLRLAIAYDALVPDPAQRYSLWVITFNHDYSVVGSGVPGATCGGVEKGMLFDLDTKLALLSGAVVRPQTQPGDHQVTWNGGPFVPTVPATWGKVKGLYR